MKKAIVSIIVVKKWKRPSVSNVLVNFNWFSFSFFREKVLPLLNLALGSMLLDSVPSPIAASVVVRCNVIQDCRLVLRNVLRFLTIFCEKMK